MVMTRSSKAHTEGCGIKSWHVEGNFEVIDWWAVTLKHAVRVGAGTAGGEQAVGSGTTQNT